MATCPVCRDPNARLMSGRVADESGGLTLRVSCPTCPIPFEISGKDLNLVAGNQREAEGRRRRWAQLLRESAQRGGQMIRLY